MEENTNILHTDADEETMSERDGELISNDWNAVPGDAPEASEDDWDAPAPEEETANQSGESFRLKHLGREFDVTRDELITLAQKGVDYDRIRERADRLVDNLRQQGAAGLVAHDQRRDWETGEFIEAYGGVRPEDIPQEVWSEVAGGKSLLSAYQSYENRRLRTELEAERREAQNRQRSTGSRTTLGTAMELGELETDWYRD